MHPTHSYSGERDTFVPAPKLEFTDWGVGFWGEREAPAQRARLDLVRELLALRRRHIAPRLAGMARGGTFVIVNGAPHVEWTLGDGSHLHMAANFSHREITLPESPRGHNVYADGAFPGKSGLRLNPAGVLVTMEAAG